MIDGIKAVVDKLTIANKFNLFFTNIEPDLAKIIAKPNNLNFKHYLNNRYEPNFQFFDITEETVGKIIDNMTPKSTSGQDASLLKKLKPVIKTKSYFCFESKSTHWYLS